MSYLIALNFEKEITLFFFTIALFISCTHDDKPYTTWAVYRGDKESTGYSALNQINKTNPDTRKTHDACPMFIFYKKQY